ncbi:hypothetical protein H9Q73_002137 [Fusarium xylarioides]|nr:hypothetical protein H9Q73_002137 [Fusarium xylarioides]
MQSKIALVTLGLIGLAAGGPCKPSSHVTASGYPVTSSVATIEVSESSTDSLTNLHSLTVTSSAETTEVPSSTLPQSSTTTQEEDIIITNVISGGSFASRDPNSQSGLTNFGASVDSIFISDQVTPDTIDNFKLDLGGSPPIDPVETTTAIRAQESPTLTTGQSGSTSIDGLESASAATSTSTTSLEVTSSATTEAKSEISSATLESSEVITTSSTDPSSGGNTDTTAISASSTSLAAGESSRAETTSSASEEIGSTS